MTTSIDAWPTVSVSDGSRRGVVAWDPRGATYRAEIDLFESLPAARPVARPQEAIWEWLEDPRGGVLPGRLIVGHRLAELVTVDALINRMVSLGFHPDERSRRDLLGLRSEVAARWGSVTLLGRLHPNDGVFSNAWLGRKLQLGLPDGRFLPIQSRFDHPDHQFGWGRSNAATMRTADVLIDLAWSTSRDAATEAAVVDLAVSVLAELNPMTGFVWRAESVADWIVTESGDLALLSGSHWKANLDQRQRPFRQLAFDFGPLEAVSPGG